MAIFQNADRQQQFKRLGNVQRKIASGNTNPNLIARQSRLQEKLNPFMQKKLASGKLNETQTNRINQRMGTATSPSAKPPLTTPSGATPTTKPAMTSPAGGGADARWAEYMKALFPQTGGLDAEIDVNKIQANPYYQHQQKKGEEALTRYNASRGLTGSTAEVGQFGDFNADLLGREVESRRNYQQQEANRAQENAGRFFNLLDSNANRAERGSQNQFNNQLSLYEAMAGKSPLEYGYGAANSRADMLAGYGKDQAGFAAQNYARGNGGGGYRGVMPSGPDYSGIEMARAIQQGRNNQNQGSNYMDLAAGLFQAFS